MTVQKITYRFTLDTFKNGVQRVLQGFQTGEDVARCMEISLSSGATIYELPLNNITASMYVKRPSQTEPSINACTIDAENNKIFYEINPADITEAGLVQMQLKVFDEDTVLISPKFAMEVWESEVEDSEAEGTTTYTALTEALAQATAMKDSAIADLYIDENNIFTVVFGDGTTYTSSVLADAIARIGSVEEYALKSEGYAVGTQLEVPVSSGTYYHNNAKYFAEQAGVSAENASISEGNAYSYAGSAEASATLALGYKNDASTSASNASTSETNAQTYAGNALTSANNASASEANAQTYAGNASTSASNASTSETNASASATSASASATSASESATSASNSATTAGGYKDTAQTYATTSKSYAVGGTSSRTGEDTDNAKYFKDRCEQIASSLEGGFIPMGTVTFANLPTQNLTAGLMYNVSDAFVSDSRFEDGGGKSYPAGTNAYVTAGLKWDCLTGALPNINGKTGSSITLDGSDLKVTGYSKASVVSDVAQTDSINEAIGKVEKKVDSSVASFNTRTGAVTPAQDDYTIGQIKATGSEGQVPTLDSNGKLAMAYQKVQSVFGRTGAVTATFADYSADQIPLTGYTKASTASSISASDNVRTAIGKLEKKADDALDSSEVNDFTITTTWVANADTGDYTNYPYKQTISTAKFTQAGETGYCAPNHEIMASTPDNWLTESEKEDILKINDQVNITTSGITLIAKEATTNALTIRVYGLGQIKGA